jgi:NAD(P)-dependent dehydrogenase (short-subunit alcohol dehydrogenase family)
MSDHRLAIVTGTSSGIGHELAQQLLAAGWQVVGLARRGASIDAPGYTHLAIDIGEVTELTDRLESALGGRVRDPALTRLALVNNAVDIALLGQVDQIDPAAMLRACAVNTVAPVVLMGWVLRTAGPTVPVRIVNVSTGAAMQGFPGAGAYGATKAALRLAGMALGAELDLRDTGGASRDASIWSHDPGVVATAAQDTLRATSAERLPIVGMFHQLEAEGRLLPPSVPAREIVAHLEADGHPHFSEQHFVMG